MQRIFIKCPETGKLVFTGFAMDQAIFDASPVELNPVKCPACGQEHHWRKSDALFEQADSTKPA